MTPRTIKIFGDKLTKLDLTSQEKSDILSIGNIIGYNNLSLQVDGRLLIKHFIGFIQVNKTRLLIYPKITNGVTTEVEFNKSFNILIKLLKYTSFMNRKDIPAPQLVGRYKEDLLEIFIDIFISGLLNQFRKDINRSYNENIENQIFIKGKIDFPETIRQNSFRKHYHYVRLEHFTENNLLNQIFKTIIKNLIKITTVKENKFKLRQGLLWLEDVQTINITSDQWDKVRFDRLNNLYKPIFNLAKLFYHNSSPNLNKGKDYVFSFLLPLNQLYEKYLYRVVKDSMVEGLAVSYQGPARFLGERQNRGYGLLRPDIVISRNGNIECIMDAKFKEIIAINESINIATSDLYQMLAYGIRYNCNNIALLYPKYLEDNENEMLVTEIFVDNMGVRKSIKVLKIDMEIEEESLARKLCEILKL